MNYIHQINGFWEKVEKGNRLNATTISLYLSLLHVCNNCNWKTIFNAQRDYLMHLSGIGSKKTYYAAIEELVLNNFLKYTKGDNQFTAAQFEILPLCRTQNGTASSTAGRKAGGTPNSTASGTIHKHINKKQENKKELDLNHIDFSKANFDNLRIAATDLHNTTDQPRTIPLQVTEKYSFEEFWNMYNKKVGKQKAEKLYQKTSAKERERIMTIHLPWYLKKTPDIQFRKDPSTYLYQKTYNDEIQSEAAAPQEEQKWFPKYPHLHKKQA